MIAVYVMWSLIQHQDYIEWTTVRQGSSFVRMSFDSQLPESQTFPDNCCVCDTETGEPDILKPDDGLGHYCLAPNGNHSRCCINTILASVRLGTKAASSKIQTKWWSTFTSQGSKVGRAWLPLTLSRTMPPQPVCLPANATQAMKEQIMKGPLPFANLTIPVRYPVKAHCGWVTQVLGRVYNAAMVGYRVHLRHSVRTQFGQYNQLNMGWYL